MKMDMCMCAAWVEVACPGFALASAKVWFCHCLRVCYYFILTCHYGLLHNIIAYKQLQYIATYFSSKDFVLTRQLQLKHAGLKRYMISLLNNIWSFDHLLAV